MIKARASGSKVYLYFMKKGRQARHRIPRNSCIYLSIYLLVYFEFLLLYLNCEGFFIFTKCNEKSSTKHGYILRRFRENIVMCLSIGTPKIINFPFVPNGKLIIFRCSRI